MPGKGAKIAALEAEPFCTCMDVPSCCLTSAGLNISPACSSQISPSSPAAGVF